MSSSLSRELEYYAAAQRPAALEKKTQGSARIDRWEAPLEAGEQGRIRLGRGLWVRPRFGEGLVRIVD